MRIYAIKDEVIGFTGSILTAQNDSQVIRMMEQMVNEPGNQMNLWPGDFSAWYIGDLDKTDGNITEQQPHLVCRGNSLIRKEGNDEIRLSIQPGKEESEPQRREI